MIGIIDYGSSNIASITNALDYLKADYKLIDNGNEMMKYSKFILPGVGSFRFAMENLEKKNFIKSIKDISNKKDNSILGICLGMQLFYSWSDEDGGCKGMDIIKGKVSKINGKGNLPVPNTGWRLCSILGNRKTLFNGIEENSHFYFVHSYGCHADENQYVTSTINYDEKQTTKTSDEIKTLITNAVTNYNTNTLQKFDSVLRYSKLLETIDDADT